MAAAKRVLRYLCSTSGMGLVLGGRRQVVLTGHADASWADDQATQRSSQGYTFSLGSGSVSWRSIRSSSVLGSSCEAEIYAGAMAAQELRWLTYLLTDLGEPPRSPPVLLCGDFVIHPELALLCLTGLVTSCFPTCTQLILLVHHSSFFHTMVCPYCHVGSCQVALPHLERVHDRQLLAVMYRVFVFGRVKFAGLARDWLKAVPKFLQ
ncbi:unnamed protein product [Closterium sp. NIES-54]